MMVGSSITMYCHTTCGCCKMYRSFIGTRGNGMWNGAGGLLAIRGGRTPGKSGRYISALSTLILVGIARRGRTRI